MVTDTKRLLFCVCLAVNLAFTQTGTVVDPRGSGQEPNRHENCPNGCTPDNGETGYPGMDGPQGENGDMGKRGHPGKFPPWFHWHTFRGAKGVKGEPGTDGPDGEKGMKGAKGLTGHTGQPGRSGLPGGVGSDGLMGAVGDKGDSGIAGPNGPAGSDGSTGMQGERGENGEKGSDGANGNTGDGGAKGDRGTDGLPGLDGQPGIRGSNGDQGDKGLSGVSGGSGGTGDPGNMGTRGTKGTKGDRGSTGEVGEMGGKGIPGHAIKGVDKRNQRCTANREGLINYDPTTGDLYYCDGNSWQCTTSRKCNLQCIYSKDNSTMNEGDDIYVKQRISANVNRPAADIIALVDDSGTMTKEHEWIKQAALDLEITLKEGNVGVQPDKPNRYSVVAFGAGPTRVVEVGGNKMYSAADVGTAIDLLTKLGENEDGYDAVEYALTELPLRAIDNPETYALNIVMITDEPRTLINRLTTSTREKVLLDLQRAQARFNLVANIKFLYEGGDSLGVDFRGLTYYAQRNDPFFATFDSQGFRDGNVHVGDAEQQWCDAYRDYGQLAIDTRGAIWDLQVLRQGGNYAKSFQSSVTFVKAREITTTEVCQRCVCTDVGKSDNGEVTCTTMEDQDYCECRAGGDSDEVCKGREAPTDPPPRPDALSWSHLLRNCPEPPE